MNNSAATASRASALLLPYSLSGVVEIKLRISKVRKGKVAWEMVLRQRRKLSVAVSTALT